MILRAERSSIRRIRLPESAGWAFWGAAEAVAGLADAGREPMAAALLMRVGELNGRLDYAEKAQETLETFAGVVEHFGLYAATYALALQRLVRDRCRCAWSVRTRARERWKRLRWRGMR